MNIIQAANIAFKNYNLKEDEDILRLYCNCIALADELSELTDKDEFPTDEKSENTILKASFHPTLNFYFADDPVVVTRDTKELAVRISNKLTDIDLKQERFVKDSFFYEYEDTVKDKQVRILHSVLRQLPYEKGRAFIRTLGRLRCCPKRERRISEKVYKKCRSLAREEGVLFK